MRQAAMWLSVAGLPTGMDRHSAYTSYTRQLSSCSPEIDGIRKWQAEQFIFDNYGHSAAGLDWQSSLHFLIWLCHQIMHGGCLCIHLRLQQSHIMLWHWGWFILQPSGCQLEIAEVSNCILIQVFVTISKQTWPNRAIWEDYNHWPFPQLLFVSREFCICRHMHFFLTVKPFAAYCIVLYASEQL